MIRKVFNYIAVYLMAIPVAVLFSCNAFAGDTGERFGFGIEYFMFFDSYTIAGQYQDIGATWSKANGQGTRWQDVEPNPPVNGIHTYDWSDVDQKVRAMHDAGFLNLQIVVCSRSDWGTKPLLKKKRLGGKEISTFPKEEHRDDYTAFISSFVERYDGDGADDMPGLKSPVLYYEVLSEAQHDVRWQGTVEEYKELLKMSYVAAKTANPDVKIILSGFMFFDLFDGGPLTDTQIADKLSWVSSYYPRGDCRKDVGGGLREQLDFNAEILTAHEYFDIVEFHLLSNYTSVEGITDWIRREMRKNGYEKPIWAGDAGIVPQIPSSNATGLLACFKSVNVFYPPHYEDGDKILSVLTSRRNRGDYDYDEVLEWFYEEQAHFLTKSIVMEMALGLAGTNIYTWLDGKPGAFMISWVKNWQISGLRDGSYVPSIHVGEPRPVYYTYKLIIDKLGKFRKVETLKNKNSQIKAYKFIVNDRLIYVMWYEDDIHHKPGEKEVSITIDASSIIGKSKVKITNIITKKGQAEPAVEYSSSKKLALTKTPIFIE